METLGHAQFLSHHRILLLSREVTSLSLPGDRMPVPSLLTADVGMRGSPEVDFPFCCPVSCPLFLEAQPWLATRHGHMAPPVPGPRVEGHPFPPALHIEGSQGHWPAQEHPSLLPPCPLPSSADVTTTIPIFKLNTSLAAFLRNLRFLAIIPVLFFFSHEPLYPLPPY